MITWSVVFVIFIMAVVVVAYLNGAVEGVENNRSFVPPIILGVIFILIGSPILLNYGEKSVENYEIKIGFKKYAIDERTGKREIELTDLGRAFLFEENNND